MSKSIYFSIAIIGFILSSGIWAWMFFPWEWYPTMYYIGFCGILLMLIGGIGYFMGKSKK